MDVSITKRHRTEPGNTDPEGEGMSNDVSWCFSGSPMSDLTERYDWEASPLGPISAWPMAWKTSLSIMLSSHFPMVLWFGPELRVLYNDAYMPQMGNKHPGALGQPGSKVWPEIWDTIGVMLGNVWRTGKPTWAHDQELLMDRHGYLEETYWTYSYSPIRQDTGKVTGIFTAVEETTSRYVAERRLETLRDVSMLASRTFSMTEFATEVAQTFVNNARDVPFALLYIADDGTAEHLKLVSQVRITGGVPPVELVIASLGQVKELPVPATLVYTSEVSARPQSMIVVPLLANTSDDKSAAASESNVLGALVIGINPYKKPDDAYFTFAKLLSSSMCAALLAAREHERERQKAEQLAELDRAKTAFFHNVSHEFRTPLTLMLGPLADMRNNAASATLSQQQRDALEIALRNGRRLLSLVNALLDFARLEAGRVRAIFRPVDLATYTVDLTSNFRSACEKAGLVLHIDIPPMTEPVFVDREMWEKIVLNLMSNAFKYTLKGGIAASLRRSPTSSDVLLKVKDTGCGIPPEELPRVFDRFHRVASAQGRTHEGTGIGLALVAELVKLHGGSVEVTSAVNIGSEFTVRIPLGRAHLPAEQVVTELLETSNSSRNSPFGTQMDWWIESTGESSSLPSTPTSAGGSAAPKGVIQGRVLAVDDNADMLAYVTRILTEGGYGVTTARDGIDALTKVREAAKSESSPMFDLIVSDVMMPRLDGRGLLNAIRKSEAPIKDIPVVFLSARAGEEEIGEGVALGADDYLVKPFSARELLTRVAARIELTRFRLSAAKREQALRETAERANKAKDHFIAVLSHELRTPLTPALMIAEAGEADPTLTEQQRQDMTMIASNIRLEVQLIGDLLDITKISQGKLELHIQPRVNMHALIHQTLALFQDSVRRHQLSIILLLSAPHFIVSGDPTRLQQILWNIIGNAVKFTPAHGNITISSTQRDSSLDISVKDNGVGIDSETIPRLFSAFEQGDVSVTRQFGGLGLGLAIAKLLVLMHQGSIEAASDGPGKGATFTVTLPLTIPSSSSGGGLSSSSPSISAPIGNVSVTRSLRILVVEDNASTQMVVGRMLQRLGQTVVIASSVKEALACLQAEKFDALLCDIGLPDGSGCLVGQAARALSPRPYAAALTGYGTDEDMKLTRQAGFSIHLVKPIRLVQLQDFVTAASVAAVTM